MDKAIYLEIRKKNNFQIKPMGFCLHLIQDFIILIAATVVWTQFSDFNLKILSAPLISLFMFRKFALFHEAVHGLVFNNRFCNDLVGILCGPFCLLPFEPWKQSHTEHHLWSGNINKDPVMAFMVIYPKLNSALKWVFRLGWRSWMPILGVVQHFVFWSLSLKILLTKKTSLKNIVSVLVPIFTWVAIFLFSSPHFLCMAVVPALFFYLVGVEVINLPHHVDMPYSTDDTRLPFFLQYKTVRSCIYPKWVARFATLNFNYHIEHHLFPDIPWYYLDELHPILKNELKDSYTFDNKFGWIIQAKKKSLDLVLLGKKINSPETRAA